MKLGQLGMSDRIDCTLLEFCLETPLGYLQNRPYIFLPNSGGQRFCYCRHHAYVKDQRVEEG